MKTRAFLFSILVVSMVVPGRAVDVLARHSIKDGPPGGTSADEIGPYPVFDGSSASTASIQSASVGATVFITHNGLEPSQVTIQTGQAVTWINQTDTAQRLVRDYPDKIYLPMVLRSTEGGGSRAVLDAQPGPISAVSWGDDIAPGGSYTRVFAEEGDYAYHVANHPDWDGRVLSAADNRVAILSPPDGETKVAELCPVAPCTAEFPFEVEVLGDPMDSAVLVFTPDTGVGFEQPLCTPGDPIEGIPPCPDPPQVFTPTLRIREGSWSVVAQVTRGAEVDTSPTVHLTVLPPGVDLPGPVALSDVDPLRGAPRILARDPDLEHPNGILTSSDLVTIFGTNLDNNPFLEVYVAPIPFGEPTFTPDSGLPTQDWCMFQAPIVNRGTNSDGQSFLRVRLPEIPLETSITCGISPGPVGSIFGMNWRFVIRDPWIRDGREHEWWAIPSPRMVPWHEAPPFEMVKPTYPRIDGFGFDNFATEPEFNEFLTVYGNNAYLCVGAFGFCATRVPDPLYFYLWWPIYDFSVGSTGGSCNGMSSTSLLMAREELQPEDFIPAVHFPVGFDKGGVPATYRDTNFCTPLCSPPQPDNLWANIRMNHGVQISREFLFEIIDTLGEAIFDPDDVTSIKGVPDATLARVRAAPQNYVVCFFEPGNGHCVTPYRVEGNKMYIYDNNHRRSDSRFIEFVGGDYNYPARTDEPNQGNAIMAFPIDIWKNGRNLLGLSDLSTVINGDVVDFLYMIAVGSGDMVVTNDNGGRWGWEDDGTFTDSLFGAVSIAPLGPQDVDARAMPLLVAMNQPAPTAEITADGGRYLFHTGAGGHLLQLEANAISGDKDQVQLGYAGGDLDSFDFRPQRDTSRFVPRVGLAIDDEESALFHWLGLAVPGGESVGFNADKVARAVTYRNDSGGATHHLLALDYGSGSGESFGRMIYGPFEVPAGASQRIVLATWPDVTEVVVELDFDRDGSPDHTQVVTGRPATPPLDQGASADLSVSKTVDVTTLSLGEDVAYSVVVANAGPDDATNVTLVDALPDSVTISSVTSTSGTCVEASGLSCQLGDLPAGEMATVTYVAKPSLPGTLTNGATVFGNEGDPDLTNNSAVATVAVPVQVDIKPGNDRNPVNPGSQGVIPVAILGQPGFDVDQIDRSTLAFGPGGSAPAHRAGGHQVDVNHDGQLDLLSHYRTQSASIAPSDTQACVRGTFRDGRAFQGCDGLTTVP